MAVINYMDFKRIFNCLLNLVYPTKCIFCSCTLEENNKYNDYTCKACYSVLPFIDKDLAFLSVRNLKDGIERNFDFVDCISAFYYSVPMSTAICNFKFYKNKSNYILFSSYVSEIIKSCYNNIHFDYITYIPMYKNAEYKREYNHSKLLAEEVARILKIPCKTLLVKTVNNKAQHNLTYKLREINVKGIYTLANQNVNNKNILIIDDIITTGYTLNEASKVLKSKGTSNVYCATVAATILKK